MADRYFDPERWRYADDDRYRDEWRRAPRHQEREPERGWSDQDWGQSGRERQWRGDYGRGSQGGRSWNREERGFWDRFGDEVRSWFGDEEAQRRRIMDEREDWGEQSRTSGPRLSNERQSWGERGWSDDRRSWNDRQSWNRRSWPSEDFSRQWGYMDRAEMSGQGTNPQRPWTSYGQGFRGGVTGGYEPSGAGTEYYGQASPMSGPFAGRGPRGWQRSDDRIKEDICERMSLHGGLDASDIEVRVASCEVTLSGSVPDRDAKRIAETLAESVSGVRDVHNQIRVSGSPGQQQPQRDEGQQRTWSDQQRRIA